MAKRGITSERSCRGVGRYSPALKAGGLGLVSGQGPVDPETLAVAGNTIEEQTLYTLDTVASLFAAAGARLEDVMKVTAYLARLEEVDRVNAIYASYFREPGPEHTTTRRSTLC